MERPGRVAAVLAAVALVGMALLPATEAGSTWTDSFLDVSLVRTSSGVRIGGGDVQLLPQPLTRQGLAFGLGQNLGGPSVVLHGGTYYLFYYYPSGGTYSIAVATSSDMSNWTDHGIVVPAGFQGTNDSGGALFEVVVVVGSTFHLWYSGIAGSGLYSILHATSTDGLNWTSAGTTLAPEVVAGIPESTYGPGAIWNGTGFMMWYTTYDGSQTSIRLATSPDGTSWTRRGVVLAPVSPDETYGARFPGVVQGPSDLVMWYNCVGAVQRFCRARSPDGRTWTREGAVLSPDPNLPGESAVIVSPFPFQTAPHQYRVWYAAGGSFPGEVYSALTSDGYASPGSVTSVPILLPANETWLWLQLEKDEPQGATVRISILDGATGTVLPGYASASATNLSLSGIDWRAHSNLELQATLASTSFATPLLLAWSVTYGLPPPAPAGPFSFLASPLFVVLLVLAAAGVLLYVVGRKKDHSPPPTR